MPGVATLLVDQVLEAVVTGDIDGSAPKALEDNDLAVHARVRP